MKNLPPPAKTGRARQVQRVPKLDTVAIRVHHAIKTWYNALSIDDKTAVYKEAVRHFETAVCNASGNKHPLNSNDDEHSE